MNLIQMHLFERYSYYFVISMKCKNCNFVDMLLGFPISTGHIALAEVILPELLPIYLSVPTVSHLSRLMSELVIFMNLI